MDAVVFDLDGVILDSEPVWEQVRRRYVADHGGHWLPEAQQRLMGMSTPEWARYLSHDLKVQLAPEQVATEVIEGMARRYAAHLPLVGGAEQVVRRLAARWPVGLATSSPPQLIDAALAAAGLAGVFAVTISTEQVTRGKPAPDVYLEVAGRLGVAPGRCVAVEDSSNGVRSASAAGMHVVAVPHPRYPLDPEAQQQVTLVVAALGELTEQAVQTLGRRDQARD